MELHFALQMSKVQNTGEVISQKKERIGGKKDEKKER